MTQTASEFDTEYEVYEFVSENTDKAFKAARNEGEEGEFVLYLYMDDDGEFVASMQSDGIFGNQSRAGTVLGSDGEDASKETDFEGLPDREIIGIGDVPESLRFGE